MKPILTFIALLAIVAAVLIAVSGPGVRLGVWEYGTGLSILRGMKIPALVLTALAGISTVIAFVGKSNITAVLFVSTIAAGVAGFVPLKFDQMAGANPFIHDITTDFGNPPAIVAGATMPRKNPAKYEGANKAPKSDKTVAEMQRDAFPNIKSKAVDLSVEETGKQALEAIDEMKMAVLETASSDGMMVIQATYTSFWFGFTDDFVVRLEPEREGTKIDVRSKSRVGVSDLGANAKRVQDFFQHF